MVAAKLQVIHKAPGTVPGWWEVIPMCRESPEWIGADITYHLNNGGNR